MWRLADADDDEAIISMCLELNAEDPGPRPVTAAQVRRTLETLRAEPVRGRAIVLQLEGRILGYALLISFWSNELGGEVCTVDALFVKPEARGKGLGTGLPGPEPDPAQTIGLVAHDLSASHWSHAPRLPLFAPHGAVAVR